MSLHGGHKSKFANFASCRVGLLDASWVLPPHVFVNTPDDLKIGARVVSSVRVIACTAKHDVTKLSMVNG